MKRLMTGLLLLAQLGGYAVHAGEINGVVNIKKAGLFGDEGKAELTGKISVVAIPAENQAMPQRATRVVQVLIENRAFKPAFVTLQAGDSIEFVNRDAVYYELFSLSKQQPFEVRLGKSEQPTSDHQKSVRLAQSGTWHVFCRIHSKAYFRVDVVDSPYITELGAGESFNFTGLGLGRWKLRVATLNSEVMWVDANAITSPPPMSITLPVMASAAVQSNAQPVRDDLAVERLFPK